MKTLTQTVPVTPALQGLIKRAEELKARIGELRQSHATRMAALEDRLRYLWTYHSNALEGSALSLSDTIFFLQHGFVVAGKPFDDFLAARNHLAAIEGAYARLERPFSEQLLLQLGAILLNGVRGVEAGVWRVEPHYTHRTDRRVHAFLDPPRIPEAMARLATWLNGDAKREHPVLAAAVAHYELARIHPFDAANGQAARLLMNWVLIQNDYLPAIVTVERRRDYLKRLAEADRGDVAGLVQLVAQAVIATQGAMVEDLESGPDPRPKKERTLQ